MTISKKIVTKKDELKKIHKNLHICNICSTFGTPLPSVYFVNFGWVPSEFTFASLCEQQAFPIKNINEFNF